MDCTDYECVCTDPVEDYIEGITARGYCRCGCDLDDHGAGHRAAEQADAEQGHAAVAAVLPQRLNLN